MIQAINDLKLTWKADTCKLQKHHVNYGSHCQKEAALALAQTKSKADEEGEASSFGQQENFAGAWDEARKYQKYNSMFLECFETSIIPGKKQHRPGNA